MDSLLNKLFKGQNVSFYFYTADTNSNNHLKNPRINLLYLN